VFVCLSPPTDDDGLTWLAPLNILFNIESKSQLTCDQ
jgi:hypothetical protein